MEVSCFLFPPPPVWTDYVPPMKYTDTVQAEHVTVFYISAVGLFWQSPKRPPKPVEFDLKDPL